MIHIHLYTYTLTETKSHSHSLPFSRYRNGNFLSVPDGTRRTGIVPVVSLNKNKISTIKDILVVWIIRSILKVDYWCHLQKEWLNFIEKWAGNRGFYLAGIVIKWVKMSWLKPTDFRTLCSKIWKIETPRGWFNCFLFLFIFLCSDFTKGRFNESVVPVNRSGGKIKNTKNWLPYSLSLLVNSLIWSFTRSLTRSQMESPGRNVTLSYDDIASLDESQDDFILPTLYHRNDAGMITPHSLPTITNQLISSLTNSQALLITKSTTRMRCVNIVIMMHIIRTSLVTVWFRRFEGIALGDKSKEKYLFLVLFSYW